MRTVYQKVVAGPGRPKLIKKGWWVWDSKRNQPLDGPYASEKEVNSVIFQSYYEYPGVRKKYIRENYTIEDWRE